MVKTTALPPKLEAVLVRLGTATSLNVTQAVKLPYLVDVVANHLLGGPITEGHHEAWDNGVVTSEVWHYLKKCDDSPVFHLEPVLYSEERRLVIDSADVAEVVLTEQEEQVVALVAREFGKVRAVDLGRMTKLMNPEISSWGTNKPARTNEDAFERLSDDYQAMAEAVSALTLERLRRAYEVVEDIEDALA